MWMVLAGIPDDSINQSTLEDVPVEESTVEGVVETALQEAPEPTVEDVAEEMAMTEDTPETVIAKEDEPAPDESIEDEPAPDESVEDESCSR
jgi:hypothetical protein